ncbi:hypothetical protein D3C79_631830 [compost metagenome]
MVLQQVAQIGLLDVGGDQVDADPLLRRQLRQIRYHLAQQLFRHRQDQSLLLRIGDKGARRRDVVVTLPAQQRFEADDTLAAAVDDGLIEGHELLAGQPGVQQPLEGAPVVAQQPVASEQQGTQHSTHPECVSIGKCLGMLLQSLTGPQGLVDTAAGQYEVEVIATRLILDGLITAREELMVQRDGGSRRQLEIEAVGAGAFENGVAPAVAQYPVGKGAPLPGKHHQLLLGVELGLGSRQPEAAGGGLGEAAGIDDRQIRSQAGAALARGQLQPLQPDVAAVELGIPQQPHVPFPAVQGEVGQLIIYARLQLLLPLHHGGLDLGALLLQQVVGQGAAHQLAQQQADQDGEGEQQRADPEG